MEPKAFLGRGWSYPVQRIAKSDIQMAEYEEDIRQAIRIILETNRGERLMRPDFGAGLNAFLFDPINTTTMALVRQRVEESLLTWEPRIAIENIDVASSPDKPAQLEISIAYRVRATNTFYNIVYPFYLQEGIA